MTTIVSAPRRAGRWCRRASRSWPRSTTASRVLGAAARCRPDVVLLDIGLPRLNGYEAAGRIRAEPWGRDMLIVALTESGTTPLWMSRSRADIPIYAFTRHESTRRRVTLYRGVYPVPFDIPEVRSQELFRAILTMMLQLDLVEPGEMVIVTKGELTGITGGTNAMTILRVPKD